METTGPRTPQIGGPPSMQARRLGGHLCIRRPALRMPIGVPPLSVKGSDRRIRSQGGSFSATTSPSTGWTPSTSGGSGRACPSDCHRCTAWIPRRQRDSRGRGPLGIQGRDPLPPRPRKDQSRPEGMGAPVKPCGFDCRESRRIGQSMGGVC